MKPRSIFAMLMLFSLVLGATVGLSPRGQAQELPSQGEAGVQAALGTAFTYQGQLKKDGSPVNDTCDFQFSLWDAATGGTQIGTPQTKTDVSVSNGLFTVHLDFGAGAFQGDARWLQIAVRCPTGTGSYTTLSPRQALTATPYALYATQAPWGGLTGVPAGFADNVDNDTTYTAGAGLLLSGTQFSLDTAYTDGRYWKLGGNSLSAEGNLGSSNNYALNLLVNNQRVLRLEPNATSPNLIGGYSGNSITSGVVGATVGGGGASGNANRVTDDYGTVGGGYNNRAGDNAGTTSDAPYATVGGGINNTASAFYASVSGGVANTASGNAAMVGGGWVNTASGFAATVAGGYINTASGTATTVGGGSYNIAAASYATIAGGGPLDPSDPENTNNRITDDYGSIGGGANNRAGSDDADTTNAPYATVGGGRKNTASARESTVCGGRENLASGIHATICGGWGNLANNSDATICGGQENTAGYYATVGGGGNNTASAPFATIGGGSHNTASGMGAWIGGGGYDGATVSGNQAAGNASTIAGGMGNTASGYAATIGGGNSNTASGDMYATVGGGSTNTASGIATTVGGGWGNIASGDTAATVSGGVGNTAGGDFSTVPGGYNAAASHYGEMAYASGQFANRGDAQTSLYVMRIERTCSVGTWYDLYLNGNDGGSFGFLTIAPGRTVAFDALVVGRTQAGESAGYYIRGVVENVGGTVSFIGAPSVTVLGEDDTAWNVRALASDTYDALFIQVQGNGETIRWVATVRTVEVSW